GAHKLPIMMVWRLTSQVAVLTVLFTKTNCCFRGFHFQCARNSSRRLASNALASFSIIAFTRSISGPSFLYCSLFLQNPTWLIWSLIFSDNLTGSQSFVMSSEG